MHRRAHARKQTYLHTHWNEEEQYGFDVFVGEHQRWSEQVFGETAYEIVRMLHVRMKGEQEQVGQGHDDGDGPDDDEDREQTLTAVNGRDFNWMNDRHVSECAITREGTLCRATVRRLTVRC